MKNKEILQNIIDEALIEVPKNIVNNEDLYFYILSKINNHKDTIELWNTPRNDNVFFINAEQTKNKNENSFVRNYSYLYVLNKKIYSLWNVQNSFEIRKCKDVLIYSNEKNSGEKYLKISEGKFVKNKSQPDLSFVPKN